MTRAAAPRLAGTLLAADGTGMVRVEDRYPTGLTDLWSALTDPARLARWIATIQGEDLRPGGRVHAEFTSGWAGMVRIDTCEAPHRLVLTLDPGLPEQTVVVAQLTADGDGTRLLIEERGLPLDTIAAYGAGWQAHAEDLGAHLAGRDTPDTRARWHRRWTELTPAYRELPLPG